MAPKLISYDIHDGGDGGRKAFKAYLEKKGWVNFIVKDDDCFELPNTVLVANRTASQVTRDIKGARKKAKDKDEAFDLKKCIVSNYSGKIVIDKDKKEASMAQKSLYRIAMSGMLP